MLQALHTDTLYIRPDGLSDSNTGKRHITEGTSALHPYTSKSFCCHLGSITLSAGANLPMNANISHTASHIMLPITGSVAYENQGSKLEARAGHTGIFLSDAKFVSKTINYSGINIYLIDYS